MNRIQYRRWKDFALRMADNGWPATITRTKSYKKTVKPAVEHFFDLLYHNYQHDITRIESWDHTRVDYRNAETFSWGVRGEYWPCVGDEARRIIDEYWNPGRSDRKYDEWDNLWGDRIRCCIRAGIDLALNPSLGVIGFCKSDIERMYPDGVPKWITQEWEQQWESINPWEPLWL